MTDDGPVLQAGPDGTQITYRGRRLYPRRPIADTKNRARRIQLPCESICIVPSPLLGYGIEDLTAGLPESSELWFVESDPALLSLPGSYADGTVYSISEARAVAIDRPDQWFLRFRRVVTVSLNGGYALNSKTYRELEQVIHRRLQRAWQNKITTITMGRLWVANTIANLPLVEASRDIRELATDKPVALVGAGPSLDRTVELISRYRSSLFVLSVDTAVRALVSRRIQPDLVCVLEAQYANLDDVAGMNLEDQPVCADISSYPGLLRRCAGHNLYLYSSTFGEGSLLSRLDAKNLRPTAIPPLGSVGAAAVAIAKRMTDAPILLFGLDFAFAHGKTHARGTPHHLRDLRAMSRLSGTDPSPFSLSARTSRVTGHRVPLPCTTSELVTYNHVTADLCKDAEVYDFTAAPLSLGRRDRSCSAVVNRRTSLSQSKNSDRAVPTMSVFMNSRVDAFVRSELGSLDTMRSLLIEGKWEEAKRLLKGLDYLTIDFPDGDRIERSAATRLLAACSFYSRRWRAAFPIQKEGSV